MRFTLGKEGAGNVLSVAENVSGFTPGDRLWVATLDVRDTAAVRKVVDRAFSDLDRIDIIVNNAGYGLFGAAEEVSDEQIRDQLDTNLIGAIQVINIDRPRGRPPSAGS